MILPFIQTSLAYARRFLLPLPQSLVCCQVNERGLDTLMHQPKEQRCETAHYPCDTSLLFDKQATDAPPLLPLTDMHATCYTLLVPDFLTIAINMSQHPQGREADLHAALPIASPLYEQQEYHKDVTSYLVMDADTVRPLLCQQVMAIFPLSQVRRLWVQQCVHLSDAQSVVFIDNWRGVYYVSCFTESAFQADSIVDGAHAEQLHAVVHTLCLRLGKKQQSIGECILCEEAGELLLGETEYIQHDDLRLRRVAATDMTIPDGFDLSAAECISAQTLFGGLLASMTAPSSWRYACQYHRFLD